MIRHRTHLGTPLLALGLALALAACSSSTNTPPQSPPASSQPPASSSPGPVGGGSTDCASLASAAEVSAIVGETVTGPNSASTSNAVPGLQATACQFTAADGTAGFSFGEGPNASTVSLVFQQSKQAQGGEDVAGLGDSAYWSASDHNLLAIQGTKFLSVGCLLASLSDPAAEKAAVVALAQMIFPKL
jgi:hypothetical protein